MSERQKHTQTNRETGCDTEKGHCKRERERGREKERERESLTHKETKIMIYKKAEIQRQPDKDQQAERFNRYRPTETNIQIDKQTDNQLNRDN